jgi:hypothetical protein
MLAATVEKTWATEPVVPATGVHHGTILVQNRGKAAKRQRHFEAKGSNRRE